MIAPPLIVTEAQLDDGIAALALADIEVEGQARPRAESRPARGPRPLAETGSLLYPRG